MAGAFRQDDALIGGRAGEFLDAPAQPANDEPVDAGVGPQPEVQAELARMVAIRVDLTRIDSAANALLQQYQVVGLPTLLLIDSHGQEQTPLRVTGFMDGPTFAARLAELK